MLGKSDGGFFLKVILTPLWSLLTPPVLACQQRKREEDQECGKENNPGLLGKLDHVMGAQ